MKENSREGTKGSRGTGKLERKVRMEERSAGSTIYHLTHTHTHNVGGIVRAVSQSYERNSS